MYFILFNVRKTKRIAKFDGLEPRRCKDIKGIVAPEIGPKAFGTFEKQATGLEAIIMCLSLLTALFSAPRGFLHVFQTNKSKFQFDLDTGPP